MGIDVATLAKNLTDFLTPFMPFLKETTERVVAGEAIKKFGTAAWSQAKNLWAKLQPKVQAKPVLQEAVEDVAQDPANEDAQAAFRLQLKKLLAEDTTLATEIALFWQEVKPASLSVTASGDRSAATGGKVTGIINTGDNNLNVMR
ncbi:MAG TPA: hypothetical protein VK211_04725 [Kamptonema sp.]|nr:hypothetical protein [Kamptonema sp.]